MGSTDPRRGAGSARAVFVTLLVASTACSAAPTQPATSSPSREPFFEVLLAEQVEWGPLNPARGDASPLAGTLWGDRGRNVPTGFLFRPVDGFASPPHLHNVSYRGVVIRGEVHNGSPSVEPTWMPKLSFWTQPKGEVHVTAARGDDVLAYIEIDEGPYLVKPVEEEFDSGEVAVNLHEANLVWVEAAGREGSAEVHLAHLWRDRGTSRGRGVLVRLAVGAEVTLSVQDRALRAVVVQGTPLVSAEGHGGETRLAAGSAFHSGPGGRADLRSEAEESVLYVRSEGEVFLEVR